MKEFPTFHCCIDQKEEDYDSAVQLYFTKEYELGGIIANLSRKDREYRIYYLKMLDYIKSLENFIITGENPISFEFIKELPAEKGWKDDYNILSSDSICAKIAFRGVTKTIEVMYYYRLLSRDEKYSKRFTPENFEFLLILRDVLFKRAHSLIKN
ncbi:MAG: hypothetical protein QXZ44_04610 [Ferroplasma sp.]